MLTAVGSLAFVTSMEQWIVLLFIGLMLFGKRLPEVLRDAGRKVAELKKTLEGLRQQMHEDRDFRELTTAAQDLRDVVTAPKRMLADTVRNAMFDAKNEAQGVVREVESAVAAGTAAATDAAAPTPAPTFEGLTDEARSTPGPDATFVEPPTRSVFEREAEKPTS